MTITLTPPSGSAYTLCAGGTRASDGSPMGPADVHRIERPGAAIREYVGADRVEGEWVKCDSGTLSFSVTRIFATEAAAAAYALTGLGSEPREGALKATEGSETVTIFSHCVMTGRETSQVGVAVAVQYTFEG